MSRPRVQHVSISRSPGRTDQACAFYSAMIGIEEVPPPLSTRHLDLVWYHLGETELYLFAEDPHSPTSGHHFCYHNSFGNLIESTTIISDYLQASVEAAVS